MRDRGLPMNVTIHQASSSDVPALASLKREVEDEVYRDLGSAEEHQLGLDEFTSPGFINALLTGGAVCKAETSDGNVVAMAALKGEASPYFLTAVYIAKQWRRSGIGSALVKELIDTVRVTVEASAVDAEAFASNIPAHRWLRRLGFEETGLTRPSETYSAEHLVRYSARTEDLAVRLNDLWA